MTEKTYKNKYWCIVPLCTNTSKISPNKIFIKVPLNPQKRKLWITACRRDLSDFSTSSTLFVCEDHFDLPNDMENYIKYKLMGGVKLIKPNVVPHIFDCQSDRKRAFSSKSRPSSEKKKIKTLEEMLSNPESSASKKMKRGRRKRKIKNIKPSEPVVNTSKNYEGTNEENNEILNQDEKIDKSEDDIIIYNESDEDKKSITSLDFETNFSDFETNDPSPKKKKRTSGDPLELSDSIVNILCDEENLSSPEPFEASEISEDPLSDPLNIGAHSSKDIPIDTTKENKCIIGNLLSDPLNVEHNSSNDIPKSDPLLFSITNPATILNSLAIPNECPPTNFLIPKETLNQEIVHIKDENDLERNQNNSQIFSVEEFDPDLEVEKLFSASRNKRKIDDTNISNIKEENKFSVVGKESKNESKSGSINLSKCKIPYNIETYLGIDKQKLHMCYFLSSQLDMTVEHIYFCLKKIISNNNFKILYTDFNFKDVNSALNFFSEIVQDLGRKLKSFIFWPKRKHMIRNLPRQFRGVYKNVISILVCLELEIDQTYNELTWSEKYKCHTIKYFISMTPDGFISYLTLGYGGKTKLRDIISECGYLDYLKKGDKIILGCGMDHFEIEDLFKKKTCQLLQGQYMKDEIFAPNFRFDQYVSQMTEKLKHFKYLGTPQITGDHVFLTDFVIQVVCGLNNIGWFSQN